MGSDITLIKYTPYQTQHFKFSKHTSSLLADNFLALNKLICWLEPKKDFHKTVCHQKISPSGKPIFLGPGRNAVAQKQHTANCGLIESKNLPQWIITYWEQNHCNKGAEALKSICHLVKACWSKKDQKLSSSSESEEQNFVSSSLRGPTETLAILWELSPTHQNLGEMQ